MNLIIKYVTPGSFTLPSKFGIRVVTSWYITYALLACLLFLFSGELGNQNLSEILANCLFYFPIAICIYGFIGIVIDKLRGNSLYYPGFYWYIYPLATTVMIAIFLIFLCLSLIGVKFPKPQNQIINPDNLRKAIRDSSFEEFQENFKDAIEEMKKMEQAGKLDPEQSETIRKLRNLDRSKYNKKVGSLLDEEEFERLFLLLLILMSLEK
ncbi:MULTISPECIES: hypothetical protein [Spirulina sp. CCY15215]|uniref:hypothetical protein n=1 Tax=Spirulina sp. CCY15215 TaxID=2767591 RepID=UPI00194DB4F5|nr:hypothetical protein [Spirulina major]